MNRPHLHIAAASPEVARSPASGSPQAIAPSEPAEAGRLALPSWAKSTECRLLLSLIAEDRPERSRVLTRTIGGTAADYGFAGCNAARLRAIWERTYQSLMDWASAAKDRDGFNQRRDAVIAYAEEFGADALIAKVLA